MTEMPGHSSPAANLPFANLVGRFLVAAPSMPDERFRNRGRGIGQCTAEDASERLQLLAHHGLIERDGDASGIQTPEVKPGIQSGLHQGIGAAARLQRQGVG